MRGGGRAPQVRWWALAANRCVRNKQDATFSELGDWRRSMLCERLLGKVGYDCERELRTLELLKVRFGEANLHGAEVMLKVGLGGG